MITKKTLLAAAEREADKLFSLDDGRYFNANSIANCAFEGGHRATHEAILCLNTALEESQLAIEALLSTQKEIGMGLLGTHLVGPLQIERNKKALKKAAKLLGIKNE